MNRLYEAIVENVWMIAAITGGIIVSILTSETHSVRDGIARILSGLFFAIMFPDPILRWLERDSSVYGNALAGLLAMTGYALARSLSRLDGRMVAEWIAIIMGRRK